MGLYSLLVNGYFQVLSVFPGPLQWLVSVLLLVGFVWLFINLIRSNALFLILLVVLLPFVIPIVLRVFTELWAFVVFLLRQVGLGV